MTDDNAGQSERERPTGRTTNVPWWAFVVGTIVLLLLISSVAWSLYLAALRREVDAKLAEIRKAGYPATLDELNAWYAYPESENAADVYQEAFAVLDTDYTKWNDLPLLGGERMPKLGEPLPPDMKKRIAEFVAANAEAIELLHHAAAIKGCRFQVDVSLGMDAPLPPLGNLRRCSLTLGLAAVLAAEDGRGDDVAEVTRSAIAAADVLQRAPDIISQLVRIACFAITTHNLERAMNWTTLTPEQCSDLAERLAAAEAPDIPARTMASERCAMYAYLLPNGGAWKEGWAGPVRTRIARATGGSVRVRLLWLDVMERYINALRAPEGELYRTITEVDRAIFGELQRDARDITDTSARMILAVLPGYRRWTTEYLTSNAQLRTARAALAVEQFRQTNGRLPAALDELVPAYLDAVPPDPFDGKPLRYHTLDKGYVVYSIGPDGIDNGGAEQEAGIYSKGDVPFRILR